MACEDGAVQPARASMPGPTELRCEQVATARLLAAQLMPSRPSIPRRRAGAAHLPAANNTLHTNTYCGSFFVAGAAPVHRQQPRGEQLLLLQIFETLFSSPPTCQVRTTSSTLYCWSSRRRNTSLSSAAGRWAQPCGNPEQAGVWVVPGSPHGAATRGSV